MLLLSIKRKCPIMENISVKIEAGEGFSLQIYIIHFPLNAVCSKIYRQRANFYYSHPPLKSVSALVNHNILLKQFTQSLSELFCSILYGFLYQERITTTKYGINIHSLHFQRSIFCRNALSRKHVNTDSENLNDVENCSCIDGLCLLIS